MQKYARAGGVVIELNWIQYNDRHTGLFYRKSVLSHSQTMDWKTSFKQTLL